jgi:hypothetical protein
MNKPPSRYDVTVRVARDDGHLLPDPAAFAVAASRAASGMNAASSARTRPRRSSALSALPRQAVPRRLSSPWPSSPARSRLRIRSGHPACERPVPAVVWRFEGHRLPELVVAAVARDLDVSHAAVARGRLPGRLAQARRPAHLRLAGPQPVTERARFRLVFEQGNGHLTIMPGPAVTSQCSSLTCTDDHAGRASGGPSAWPEWPGALALGADQPRPILGDADPGHRLHRRRHWFRRLRPTGNHAAGSEGVVRGSSPASGGPASEGDASEADVTQITMQFLC